MSKKTKRFPATLPRQVKRSAGATGVLSTPLAIRAQGIELSMGLEDAIRTKLTRKLGKFADRIERMTVRFEDVNGPKGGVDFLCRTKVVLSGIPSVVVNGRGETDRLAFDAVVDALARVVRKSFDKSPRGHHARPIEDAASLQQELPLEVVSAAPAPKRKAKAKTSKATAKLEDSGSARPSRKSSRKSANRTLGGTALQRKASAAKSTPSAKATRPSKR